MTTYTRFGQPRPIVAPLVALAAAFALSCGASRPASFELTSYQTDKQAMIEQYTKLDRGKKFRGVSRVFIPSFQVEYIVTSSASASSYSVGGGGSTRTASFYEIAGLDNERVQAITDSLYAKFVSDLAAQGIEVVTLAELEAQPAWLLLKEKGEPTPVLGKSRIEPKAGKSIVSTPTGSAVYYTQTDPKIGLVGAFKNIGAINRGENAGSYEGQLMEALDADMVKSRLVIGFAQIETEGGRGNSSSVSADYRFTVAPTSSHVMVVRDFKKSKAPFSKNMLYIPQVQKVTHTYLAKPLFSPAPFIQSVEDTTSVGSIAGEAVLNTLSILGSLAGGGGSSLSKSRVYAVTIDPMQYQTSAELYSGVVFSMFNDQLMSAH